MASARPRSRKFWQLAGNANAALAQPHRSAFPAAGRGDTDIDPGEAVAIGAALQASSLAAAHLPPGHNADADADASTTIPCLPLTISIDEAPTHVVTPVLCRGTPLPCQATKEVDPSLLGETLQIFEGERALAQDCFLVASLPLNDTALPQD